MMKAFQHENPKVRGEALAALRRFPIDKVRPVFIEALRDSNLQVQLNALRTLAYYRDHSAVDEILGVIESKDFFDYPLNVKKRFYVTLANIEGTAVVSYLVKVLRKNRFWLGSINTDIRISAAHALGTIGSPDTLKVLNRFSKNWNRSLRMACKEALQHQKTGQSSGGGLMLEPLDTQMVQNKRKGDDIILEPLND
jgi:HEAT repeat protein